MKDEQALKLLQELNRIAQNYENYEYGLPVLSNLENLDPENSSYDATCLQLIDAVKDHFKKSAK